MVDPDRMQHRLELLYGYLGELRRLRDVPVDEYVARDAYAGRVHAAIGSGLSDIDAFAAAVALAARPDG